MIRVSVMATATTAAFMIVLGVMVVPACFVVHMPAGTAAIAKIQQDHSHEHHGKN